MPQAPVRLQQVVCAYCASNAHEQCPGAIRIPATERVIVCKCCTPESGMCTTCGNRNRDEVDPITWYCLDRYACSARIQARCEQSPLYRMLQDVRLDSAAHRRRQRLDVERMQSNGLPTGEPDSFQTTNQGRVRGPARPKSGNCLCCGEPTKGGKFRPGHDAKMKGKLQRAAVSGDQSAVDELVKHGWPIPKGVLPPEGVSLTPTI